MYNKPPINIEELIAKAYQLHLTGDFEQAKKCYQQAIAVEPTNSKLLNNLGCVYASLQQPITAKEHFQNAINNNPAFPDPYNNLGNILLKESSLKEAKDCFQKALELNPSYADAHNNFGSLLQQQGETKSACQCFKHAIAINNKHLDAINNLGNILNLQGQHKEARKYFREVLTYDQNHPIAYYNMGISYAREHEHFIAQNYLKKALSLANNNLKLHCSILTDYLFSSVNLSIWHELKSLMDLLINNTKKLWQIMPQFNLDPFVIQALSFPLEFQLETARKKSASANLSAKKITHNAETKAKLRIGYLSPDFNEHPIALLLRNFFSYHDRKQFDIYGYLTCNKEDSFTKVIRTSCDKFFNLSKHDAQGVAKKIHADQIDILVDLTGFAGKVQLPILAQQPAPIQCHWMGYVSTMQSDYIQYFIADQTIVPQNIRHIFTENIVYLPHSIYATAHFTYSPVNRADFDIPEDQFVYCCFCNTYRIQPDFFTNLLTILEKAPNSILWLYCKSECSEQNLLEFAKTHGITSNRIKFLYHTNTTDHWAHQVADLYLDTYPISGATGTLLSLWANLPVITIAGSLPESRITSSILNAAKLDELICHDAQAYINKAIELYHNRDAIKELKQKIKQEKSSMPVFNAPLLAQHLEKAYLAMWSSYVNGTAEDIHVKASGTYQ